MKYFESVWLKNNLKLCEIEKNVDFNIRCWLLYNKLFDWFDKLIEKIDDLNILYRNMTFKYVRDVKQ